MRETAPTILALETDSAWVVIVAVSLITLVAALLARRLIAQPGGFASGLLLSLPLMLPVLAAVAFHRAVLPEIGVLRPAGPAALRGSGQLLHLLVVPNPASRIVTPYALSGSTGRWLLVFGALASTVMLLRRATGTFLLRRLIARCRPLRADEDHNAAAMLDSLVGDRTAGRPTLLLLPDEMSGAFAVGMRQPKILLSADLLGRLDAEELEAILAHEIAHLEARDVPIVFLAGFLRDLVAWNPVAHVAFRHLVSDREHEADRRAAVMTGKPLAVASGLLKMCELMRGRPRTAGAAALGFFTARRGITGRVTRLMALADGVAPATATHRLPHLLAALLVAVLGLQVGSEMTARDRGAFAVVVGTHDISSAGVWVPKRTSGSEPATDQTPRHRHERHQQRKGRVGDTPAGRPLEHPDIWSGVSVKAEDLPKWERRMSQLVARQGVAIKLRWQGRQDWQAIPLFAPSGGVGVYRIERTL